MVVAIVLAMFLVSEMMFPFSWRWHIRSPFPFPFILRTMSQHFLRDVLEFSWDTNFCQDSFFCCLMIRLDLALHILTCSKFAGLGWFSKTLRALFLCVIASMHSLLNQGFGGLFGFAEDLGMYFLLIAVDYH